MRTVKTAAEKALDLLIEARVMVKRVDPDSGLVIAQVRGDSGAVYDCGRDPKNGQWRCTCPELRGKCSHLIAVKRVVAI